ncbi:MAG: outer membrane lipoprotein-sorting protein [Candidatus Brocadiae bacterium]|nr:outer membrane lipoprotein-sorting protein [Candidatus Brocadiia bacterium]
MKILFFLLVFAYSILPCFAQDNAMEILIKSDHIRAAESWGFYIDILDYKDSKILTHNKYQVTSRTFGVYPDAIYKSTVFALQPKNVAGQKTLKNGQVYWQFFPSTKNLVRISGAQRMSGQVNAADIASSNYRNDYVPSLVSEKEIVLQKECYKLELVQKNPDVAYYKLLYWVEKGTYHPVKVQYYAVSGKHLKTAYYRDFKMAMGRLKPHEIFIVDPLEENQATRMIYSGIHEENMPEHFFSKDSLATLNRPLFEDNKEISAEEIIQEADKKRCSDNWKFHLTVYEFHPQEGKSEPKMVSRDEYVCRTKIFENTSKCYAEFLAPKSVKGQKLLREGRVFWLFIPGTKNIVRISASQKLSGQATAGDIASTDFLEDYEAKIVGSEKVFKHDCYKLELIAKDENVAYQKLFYWVDKENFYPRKIEYYALSGKHLKTGYYKDFKALKNGEEKAHELFLLDPINKDYATRILYSNIEMEESPEYLFRKENLK